MNNILRKFSNDVYEIRRLGATYTAYFGCFYGLYIILCSYARFVVIVNPWGFVLFDCVVSGVNSVHVDILVLTTLIQDLWYFSVGFVVRLGLHGAVVTVGVSTLMCVFTLLLSVVGFVITAIEYDWIVLNDLDSILYFCGVIWFMVRSVGCIGALPQCLIDVYSIMVGFKELGRGCLDVDYLLYLVYMCFRKQGVGLCYVFVVYLFAVRTGYCWLKLMYWFGFEGYRLYVWWNLVERDHATFEGPTKLVVGFVWCGIFVRLRLTLQDLVAHKIGCVAPVVTLIAGGFVTFRLAGAFLLFTCLMLITLRQVATLFSWLCNKWVVLFVKHMILVLCLRYVVRIACIIWILSSLVCVMSFFADSFFLVLLCLFELLNLDGYRGFRSTVADSGLVWWVYLCDELFDVTYTFSQVLILRLDALIFSSMGVIVCCVGLIDLCFGTCFLDDELFMGYDVCVSGGMSLVEVDLVWVCCFITVYLARVLMA
eukprot:gene2942-1924_t